LASSAKEVQKRYKLAFSSSSSSSSTTASSACPLTHPVVSDISFSFPFYSKLFVQTTNYQQHLRFQVLTVTWMKTAVFCPL
jgi:hypothetical protein